MIPSSPIRRPVSTGKEEACPLASAVLGPPSLCFSACRDLRPDSDLAAADGTGRAEEEAQHTQPPLPVEFNAHVGCHRMNAMYDCFQLHPRALRP